MAVDSKNKKSKRLSTIPRTEKMRLRPWLQQQADFGDIHGLRWMDDAKTELRIPWLHGSKQTWCMEDVLLFQRWAEHTGRFSQENICPKRWKANFRCALKSLNDVVELQCCGQTRGKDAYRIYKFLSPGQLSKKRRGSSAHDDGAFKMKHTCWRHCRKDSLSCDSPAAQSSGYGSGAEDDFDEEESHAYDDSNIKSEGIDDMDNIIIDKQQFQFVEDQMVKELKYECPDMEDTSIVLIAADHAYSTVPVTVEQYEDHMDTIFCEEPLEFDLCDVFKTEDMSDAVLYQIAGEIDFGKL